MNKPNISRKLYLVATLMDDFVQHENKALMNDLREATWQNRELTEDLISAGNSIAFLTDSVGRGQTQLESSVSRVAFLTDWVAQLEQTIYDLQTEVFRLRARNTHLVENLLDCTCTRQAIRVASSSADSELSDTESEDLLLTQIQ